MIKTLHILQAGDPAAAIPSTSYSVELIIERTDYTAEALDNFKHAVMDAFEELLGEAVTAAFDDDLRGETYPQEDEKCITCDSEWADCICLEGAEDAKAH